MSLRLLSLCAAPLAALGHEYQSTKCQAGSLPYSECDFWRGTAPFNQQKCFAGINTGQNAQGGCDIPSPSNGCFLKPEPGTLVWKWSSTNPFVDCCNCFQAKGWNPGPGDHCPSECQSPECVGGSPNVAGSKPLVQGKCWNTCSRKYNNPGGSVRYCGRGGNFDGQGSVDCSGCKHSLLQTGGEVDGQQRGLRLRASASQPGATEVQRHDAGAAEGEEASMLQVPGAAVEEPEEPKDTADPADDVHHAQEEL